MEIELKYACPDETVCKLILESDMVQMRQLEAVRQLSMRTRYYDTPQGDLCSRHWTLRLRWENGSCVACCKTGGARNGALSSHGEWECPAEKLSGAVQTLVTMGAPEQLLQIAEHVHECCGAEFLRQSVDLQLENGTIAELSCDTGVLLGMSDWQPLCEIELELRQGAVEPMLAFGAELAGRYALTAEPRSKLARALTLR